MFSFGARSQRGVTTVEYLVIVAGVALVAVFGAGQIGVGVSSNLCETGKTLGASGNCVKAAASSSSSATSTASSTTAVVSGGSSGSGGGSSTSNESTAAATATADSVAGGTVSTPSATATATPTATSTPTPTPTPTNSVGSMVYNTATIDQDDAYRSDLSVRVNLGWFPSNWNQVTYPTTMSIEVTWSPALAVDKVITGSDGTWTYTLIEPGRMLLTRTGSFDTSGFQPEPEILLTKPASRQTVQVSFSATAPNSPTVTRSASTTSIPY